MPTLEEFFLNSPSRVIRYETVEISHPSFSQVYRIVRNARFGINAKIETGSTVAFVYYPLQIETTGSNGTLDQSFRFSIGDLGSLVHGELENVIADDTFDIKPQVVYRAYRSDDLDHILYGPIKLELTSIPVNHDGFTFEAKPWQANQNTTGENYTLGSFPGLRGFL